MADSAFETACRAVDRANGEDPRTQVADGRTWPQEVLYSRRMIEWVRRLAPAASDELLLAARAQHIGRWKTPRSSYPEGRAGYLQWRETLKKFHAETAGRILREAGYGEESVKKVAGLILRKNFAPDPEGQTLEDAACLVFLEFEFAEFSKKTDESKVLEILRKTWKKMSARAHEFASRLPLDAREAALLGKALGGAPGSGAGA